MAGSETIEWHLAEDTQPDEGILVLVHAPDAPEPVWPGSLDSGDWYWVDGSPVCFDVIEWAHMPVGSTVEDDVEGSVGYDIHQRAGGIGFGEFRK